MKALLAAVLLTIVGTSLPAQASYQAKVPHPEGGTQTSSNGRFSPARYSFRFHVTGHTLSELRFTAPIGMQLSQSIDVMDQNGQKVAATIGLEGQVAVVTFAQPVALDSKLSIDLNDVKTTDNSRIRELETSGKLDNFKEDISLQTIRLSPGYR
jgi:hypothetical protein